MRAIRFLVFLVIFSSFGWIYGEFKDSNTELSANSNIASPSQDSASTVVEFLDGKYSTIKPSSWKIMNDLNDEADLQMGNDFKEAYAIVLSESKEDYDFDSTLEEYSEITSNFILEGLENLSITNGENLVLNGQPAIKYEFTGSMDRVRVRYWHISIESEDHYHQLLLWSLPSKFEKNKADFESVMNSFQSTF